MTIQNTLSINWFCNYTWLQASKNTSWCLLGCCIGDFGTIAFFQFTEIAWPVLAIMSLAIVNGIFTSIVLETFILSKQMSLNLAFKTAIGMSLVSMISMEVAMNITDFVFQDTLTCAYCYWKPIDWLDLSKQPKEVQEDPDMKYPSFFNTSIMGWQGGQLCDIWRDFKK